MPKFRLSPGALRAQRVKAGVSRIDAAVAIGRSVETIDAYESGRNTPPVAVLLDLVDHYRCNVSDVVEAIEPEPAR